MVNPNDIGSRIKVLRENNNMTQEQLGKMLGVGKSAVYMWEMSKNTPSSETITKISEIFNVSADYLIKGNSISESDYNTISSYLVKKGYIANSNEITNKEIDRIIEIGVKTKKILEGNE